MFEFHRCSALVGCSEQVGRAEQVVGKGEEMFKIKRRALALLWLRLICICVCVCEGKGLFDSRTVNDKFMVEPREEVSDASTRRNNDLVTVEFTE